jgi:homoserine kinase type II
MMLTIEALNPVVRHWGLTVIKIRDDLSIDGSPERCLSRIVMEDDRGRLFILEDISPQNLARKEEIAETLSGLSHQGLTAVHPCLLNASKSYITRHENLFLIVRPYIKGVPLARPEYVYDGWRGRAMAEFLVALKEKSPGMTAGCGAKLFSIMAFIFDLAKRMGKHNKELISDITPVIRFLEMNFFTIHDRLPVGFCHGDYHPLNIIWSEDAILSVIDWEFSGLKPEIYDMAILIGCIGMEDPAALRGPFIKELLRGLENVYSQSSLQYLLEFVIAVRFAWLSEWLRNADRDMITLEIDYMTLLIQERPFLKDAWFRSRNRPPSHGS